MGPWGSGPKIVSGISQVTVARPGAHVVSPEMRDEPTDFTRSSMVVAISVLSSSPVHTFRHYIVLYEPLDIISNGSFGVI